MHGPVTSPGITSEGRMATAKKARRRAKVAPEYERADLDLILSIARRYTRLLQDWKVTKRTTLNDVSRVASIVDLVHKKTPLNLHRLAEFDDANFGHDVGGILKYADEKGNLTRCFDPRCGERSK
jgi:hypothetical protein